MAIGLAGYMTVRVERKQWTAEKKQIVDALNVAFGEFDKRMAKLEQVNNEAMPAIQQSFSVIDGRLKALEAIDAPVTEP